MKRLYVLLASAVIATTLIVVAAGASAAPASEDFLAVAYSRSLHEAEREVAATGKHITASYGGLATTLGRAKYLALNNCVKGGGMHPDYYTDDCKGIAWVHDGFLGLAIEVMRVKGPPDGSYEPKYGWAIDRRYVRAKGRALDACYAAGMLNADCEISYFGSTDGAGIKPDNFDGGSWNTPTVPPPH